MFASQVVSQPVTMMAAQPITTTVQGVSGIYGGPSIVSGGIVQPRSMVAAQPVTVLGGAATMATRVGAVTEVDQVNAFGQVVERDLVQNLGGGVTEIDRVNAFGQVFERDLVVGGAARQLGAPVQTGLNGVARVLGTSMGVTEIDRVNQFGQVVERDFVVGGGVTQAVGGGAARIIGSRGVTEIDRVNQFGQVVERDFIGSGGVTQMVGAGVTYGTAPIVTYAAAPM